MASLKDLKNRTKTIKSTAKITQAMKLISASRLNKFSQQIRNADEYNNDIVQVLGQIYKANNKMFSEFKNSYISENGKKGVLLVVIGSDKGLCGTFNVNLAKQLDKKISYYNQKRKNLKIICFGKKILQYIEKNYEELLIQGENIMQSRELYTDTFSVSLGYARELLDLLKNNEFQACEFIYTSYISTIKSEVAVERVLPINKNQLQQKNEKLIPMLDNSTEKIFQNLMTNLFYGYFHKFLLNSVTAEYASRMMAMDNATNNAKQIISDLKMEYNRKRQAYITKELIEIISGAEAIS